LLLFRPPCSEAYNSRLSFRSKSKEQLNERRAGLSSAHRTFSSLVQSDVIQFLRHSTLLMWQCLASKIYRRLVRSNSFVCLTVRFHSSNSQHSEEMETHYVISSCAALFVSKPNQETIQFLQRHTSRHQKLHRLAIQTFSLLCFIKHYSL